MKRIAKPLLFGNKNQLFQVHIFNSSMVHLLYLWTKPIANWERSYRQLTRVKDLILDCMKKTFLILHKLQNSKLSKWSVKPWEKLKTHHILMNLQNSLNKFLIHSLQRTHLNTISHLKIARTKEIQMVINNHMFSINLKKVKEISRVIGIGER